MSRDRFLLLKRYWHFSDNTADHNQNDRLYKLRDFINHINDACQAAVKPGAKLVIDESMIPWRGRLVFRQYLPNKTHKYGVKVYKLCTVEGYTLRLILYCGKSRDNTGLGHSHAIVLELLEGYLNEGRTLFCDNFYTGIPLAEDLAAKNTYICGTLKTNRKGIAQDMKGRMKKGECIGRQCQHGTKIIHWVDKRSVLMLTNVPNHDDTLLDSGKTSRKGEAIMKPLVVMDYNSAKKGVDFSDQMGSYHSSVRKSLKWYRKVALELISSTLMVNSWILYNLSTSPTSSHKKLDFLAFQESVAIGLVGKDPKQLGTPSRPTRRCHTLVEKEGQARVVRKRCKVCYKANRAKNLPSKECDKVTKQVTTYCEECPNNPFMCLKCFNDTHTK